MQIIFTDQGIKQSISISRYKDQISKGLRNLADQLDHSNGSIVGVELKYEVDYGLALTIETRVKEGEPRTKSIP